MTHRPGAILSAVLRPVLFAIYGLSGLMPRDRRLWLFGSWSGRRYADNAAALFEFVNSLPDSGVRAVWISQDRAIVAELRREGLQAHHAWSLAGIWAGLRGGVYIFDGLTKDVNHWLCRGAKRVLLRHGVGIKRIERSINNPNHRLYKLFHGRADQRLLWSVLIPWHRLRPDFAIATSPDHVTQGAACYGIGPERFTITGFPRNDRLLADTPETGDEDLRWLQEQAAAQRSVFLYMPTFRDDQRHFSIDWTALDAMAGRLGIKLMVKLHYVDAERGFPKDSDGLPNLRLADAYLDANRLYTRVAGLISDYSSASYDFMLTGRPVVFFIPDRDQYKAYSRTLYYDFDSVAPGPRPASLAELEACLEEVLAHGLGRWTQQYSDVLDRFHTYRDARACQRVYEEIVRRFLPGAKRVVGAAREVQQCES